MNNKIIAALVLLILVGAGVSAQDAVKPVKMTADDSVAFALAHNIGLTTENLKTAIAKRNNDFSWNKLMPTLSVGAALVHPNVASLTIPNPNVPTVTYPGFGQVANSLIQFTLPSDVWELGLNLTAQWTFSVATIHAINQTAIDYANSQISQETARKKLERDVRKSFNQLLALQEALKLTQRQITNAETRYNQALSSYKAGLTSNLQVLQAQVNWENKKPALADQQLNYNQALMAFEMSLGLDVQTPITLDGSINTDAVTASLSANDFIAQHLEQRLDVQSLRGSVASLDNTIKIQESLRLPSLIVSYTADPGIGTNFSDSGFFAGSKVTDLTQWKQNTGNFMVALRWQLDSLIPGFVTATTIDNLKDQKAQLEQGLAQTKTAAQMEIINLVDRIKKSSGSLETLALNVELAQKAYKQTDEAYRAGNQTLADVQDADVQQQAALFQVLNEQLTLANNLLDLEYALNTSKTEFLKGVKP